MQDAKNVAHAVHLDVQIEFAHPAGQQIPTGLLGIGEGDACASVLPGILTDGA